MTDIEKIYTQYFETVYRYVLSLSRDKSVADDITQDTFFKAMNHLDKFKGDCKLSVWLCQIAKNTYLSYLEKANRTIPISEEIICGLKISGPEDTFVNKETADSIHRILHQMPEPYKEVFTLRTFGELPYVQIGKLFNKTEGWARVTYHRGKLMIINGLAADAEKEVSK